MVHFAMTGQSPHGNHAEETNEQLPPVLLQPQPQPQLPSTSLLSSLRVGRAHDAFAPLASQHPTQATPSDSFQMQFLTAQRMGEAFQQQPAPSPRHLHPTSLPPNHHQNFHDVRHVALQTNQAPVYAPPSTGRIPSTGNSEQLRTSQQVFRRVSADNQQQYQRLLISIHDFHRQLGEHRACEYETMVHINAAARDLGLPPPCLGQHLILQQQDHHTLFQQLGQQALIQEQKQQQLPQQQDHHTPTPQQSQQRPQAIMIPSAHPTTKPFTRQHSNQPEPAQGPHNLSPTSNPNPAANPLTANTPTTAHPPAATLALPTWRNLPARRPLARGQWWSVPPHRWNMLAAGTRKRYSLVGRIMETEMGGDVDAPCNGCVERIRRPCRVMRAEAFYRGCGIASRDKCASCVMLRRACSLARAGEGEAAGSAVGGGGGDDPGAGSPRTRPAASGAGGTRGLADADAAAGCPATPGAHDGDGDIDFRELFGSSPVGEDMKQSVSIGCDTNDEDE
ncbi:hypothetical protein MPH_07590 [Macrophomina phaseolina MS6]|uniref:Uncharacterized protein n=1 Tax=Macrophomina phaseolina (strain MS6) TaxID=1126212 RepID=K2QZ41_MACPH|nr:hypothetical protein MPH_07590 [Macrophomina phaseolina MS6]